MKGSPLKPSTKRMKSHRKSPRPGNRSMSTAERKHTQALKEAGCLCCIQRGYEPEENAPMAEGHHLKPGNVRLGHMFMVGLCEWHHKAQLVVDGWDHKEHRLRLGPWLLEGAIPFHRMFGSDDDLLRMQADLLQGQSPAAPTKITGVTEWEH